MLTLTPCCSRRPVKVWRVNCAPWSVLNISGTPFLRASSRASTQKLASRVFDSRQANTYRLYQSMMATRYKNPRAIGMYFLARSRWARPGAPVDDPEPQDSHQTPDPFPVDIVVLFP